MQHLWVSAKNPPKEEGRYFVLTDQPIPHMEIASYLFDMWVNNDNVVIKVSAYDANKVRAEL